MSKIEIKKVESKKDLKKFIRLPYKIFKGNPYWVPLLEFDELNTLDKKKNPAFEYCDAEYWLAYKDGEIVGRIAGILNKKSNETWKQKHVRFGWVDFVEDFEVAKALFDTVENWARDKGMTHVHGPLGFTDMDHEGMLVKGFDQLSSIASIYNHPYYPEYLEKLGYKKDIDWVQYKIKVPQEIPEKVKKYAEWVTKRYNLTIVKVKKPKELLPYAKGMFETMNKAFSVLYSYVELTPKQIDYYIKQYFSFINPDFVNLVVDENKNVVAFAVTIPSLSKGMQKANGHLLPFGWYHILKSMKTYDIAEMLLIGVHPDYQKRGVPAIIHYEMHKTYLKYGVKYAITSHQLENNKIALNLWDMYPDKEQHIRRRAYIKEL
jgi:GNAT superfamily N-acetyltransferase